MCDAMRLHRDPFHNLRGPSDSGVWLAAVPRRPTQQLQLQKSASKMPLILHTTAHDVEVSVSVQDNSTRSC